MDINLRKVINLIGRNELVMVTVFIDHIFFLYKTIVRVFHERRLYRFGLLLNTFNLII